MVEALEQALAMEFYTAAQALEYRQAMLNAARTVARRGDVDLIASKIGGAPDPGHPDWPQFRREVAALVDALATADSFHPGERVAAAFRLIRGKIAFMQRDRAMDGDIARIIEIVRSGALDALVEGQAPH
jgi:histidine ammonia-lyase